jgi:hypothetical protein
MIAPGKWDWRAVALVASVAVAILLAVAYVIGRAW